MATDFSKLKKFLDLPMWDPIAPAIAASAAGVQLVADERNNADSDPFLYLLLSATAFYRYSPIANEWQALNSPALAGTFGAGAGATLHPTQGPRGVLAAGNTTSKVVISTALNAAVGINQLANRGDSLGYKIRIIGNAAGSSGKIEERRIVANTAGTAPTLWLDSPLSFTPAAGDAYEILSGRIYLLSAGALAAGTFKAFDICTNSFITLSQTNLPATIANDSAFIDMSEANVPFSRSPGEGYFGALTATSSAAGTLTGQAAGGDSGVLANEFRNFQIRITQDTTTPTAVGQRRRIASHTAGVSPIYTLASNWTVTPSANAQFVIEYDDDKLRVVDIQRGDHLHLQYRRQYLGHNHVWCIWWGTRSGRDGVWGVGHCKGPWSERSTVDDTCVPRRQRGYAGYPRHQRRGEWNVGQCCRDRRRDAVGQYRDLWILRLGHQSGALCLYQLAGSTALSPIRHPESRGRAILFPAGGAIDCNCGQSHGPSAVRGWCGQNDVDAYDRCHAGAVLSNVVTRVGVIMSATERVVAIIPLIFDVTSSQNK